MEGVRYVRCRDCRHCRVFEVKGEELKRLGQPLRKLLEWGRMPQARVENIMNASAEVAICLLDDGERLPEVMLDRPDDLECWESY